MLKNEVKSMKKTSFFTIIFAIMLCFATFFVSTSTVTNDSVSVVTNDSVNAVGEDIFTSKINYQSSAKSAFLMEALTGRVLYSKNAEQALPMASTTKIVTAITVLDNYDDLDTPIKINSKAVGVSGTSIYLQQNEELTVRELLYGLMLRSGNDASVALAYEVGGSVENFCEMMNTLAKKVGAENSNFVNPHGLDADGHYTTAHDLAVITAYALENKDFAEIVSTKTKTICKDKENSRYLLNKNKLLANLDGCIGVKTGFTDDAGRCLVSACERDGLRLVSVVFNCGPMFEESSAMFERSYEKFKMVELLPPYYYIKSAEVENGEDAYVGLYSQSSFSLPLTQEEESNINIIYDAPDKLEAPLEKGQEVGKVEIFYGNHLLFSEKVYTIEEVDSKLFKDKIKDILDDWNA